MGGRYIYYLTRRTLMSMHREASEAGGGGGDASGAGASGALPNLTKRLRGFLLVFGIINTFQLLNRVYDVFSPGHPSFFLYLLQSILGPIQGLGNALVYGWSPQTRRVWSSACPTICGWATPPEARGLHGSPGGGRRGPQQVEITPSNGLAEDSLASVVSSPNGRL